MICEKMDMMDDESEDGVTAGVMGVVVVDSMGVMEVSLTIVIGISEAVGVTDSNSISFSGFVLSV